MKSGPVQWWIANRNAGRYAGLVAITTSAIGVAFAIGAMEWLTSVSGMPLWAVPFATSIVLVMGSPEAPPAQPRALIGGHMLSTLIGLGVLALCGPEPWAAALAVGLSVLAMQLTGTFHPPAGINPLIVVINDSPWTFLFSPVLAGAVALFVFANLWMNVVRGHRWPQAWL